ncbi:MAG: biotin/lipoyl-containing protein [Mesorhizobium sp.]
MSFRLSIDGVAHDVEIVRRRPHLVVRIDGREHEISDPGSFDEGRQSIEIGGAPLHFARAHSGDHLLVRAGGRTFEAALVDPRAEADAAGGGLDVVKAPMPGAVVSTHKQAGDEVKRGETLVTIESMKLQTALVAPRDGLIAEMMRLEGQTFEKDEVLVRLEPAGEA